MSTRHIKALMILNGVRSIDIARKAGVTETWVSLVLNGHKNSARIRKAIAASVGKEVEDLWPNGGSKAA